MVSYFRLAEFPTPAYMLIDDAVAVYLPGEVFGARNIPLDQVKKISATQAAKYVFVGGTPKQ